MGKFAFQTLRESITSAIRSKILTGELQPGVKLAEQKLAEEFGSSRAPIREALRRLEQERLIEDTGKGSRVVGITEEDLEDIMNIRQRIEGLAAYYAAKNMTPEGLAELTHIVDLQDFYYDKGDAEQLRQVDEQFHDLICYLSKRTVIMDTLIPLHRKTRRYRRISMEDWSRTVNTRKEHKAIFDAMASGDADLAESLMAKHIENAKKHMLGGFINHG